MAISAVQTYLSPEEYITLERKAKPDVNIVRNEYIQGKIIAMSGASSTHNFIKGNIFVQLHNRLIGSSCVVFANEMRGGEKFSRYRQIDSLKEYILVSQDSVNVERFLRKSDEWSSTFFQGLEQHLPLTSFQCELPPYKKYMGTSHYLKPLKEKLSTIMTWAPKVCSLVGKFCLTNV